MQMDQRSVEAVWKPSLSGAFSTTSLCAPAYHNLMPIPNTLKLLGALLLIASIALPMSSCTVTEEPDDKHVFVSPESKTSNDEIEYTYVLDYFDHGDPATWITLIVFSWPVLALAFLQWKRDGRAAMVIRGLEPLLLIGSLIWVEFISTFFADRREIGAYLAFCAIGIYAIGAIWSDVALYRNWKYERHS